MPPWIICRIPCSYYLHKFPNFRSISLFSFSTSTPKISLFDYLVNHHNFSPECASKVSSLSSGEYLEKPQNADSVLEFLKEIGLSQNQIQAVVQKASTVLYAKPETSIKPKIKVFQDMGFHCSIPDIVSTNPMLLNTSADRIRLSILRLKNVLGPNADICRLLKNYGGGRVVGYDLSRTLLPNIEYLKSFGICSLQIAKHVCYTPQAFFKKPDKFKAAVKRVDELGFDRKSNMFLEAVRMMSSISNWELKFKVFRDLGFAEENILHAFRVYPGAFTVSKRKIEEVTQLLLSVGNMSFILTNPRLLGCSVEKRLKPRLRVLKALECKNLLKKKPRLSAFFQMTDANFINKFVIPHSDELGDVYVASQGS